jgi:hypothetical protein
MPLTSVHLQVAQRVRIGSPRKNTSDRDSLRPDFFNFRLSRISALFRGVLSLRCYTRFLCAAGESRRIDHRGAYKSQFLDHRAAKHKGIGIGKSESASQVVEHVSQCLPFDDELIEVANAILRGFGGDRQ